ncbi:hypothetical protein ANCCEY_06398 [Ancylostoma ceylanicum]|uniref:THAP-type domain-containing protein n=1 Tax=Ancylostoma ceylanicum TaxID=53326 RepID=A0A0D6LTI1_9BILA|nr:hypothetical protein ANCCEY_06398 [Ancylostoma ceylanicum]
MISRRTWEDMKSPKLDRSTITIRTADGSAMNILGSFNAAFTIFDRKGRPTEGTGCCYVTESTDLLGLEWCIQMHDYKELREQYSCKLASAAIENARDDIVNRLKTRFTEILCKMYIGKRLTCDRNLTKDRPQQDYATLSAEPISVSACYTWKRRLAVVDVTVRLIVAQVVDDVCAENEEDGYEEMDEEDEEYPTCDWPFCLSTPPLRRLQSNTYSKNAAVQMAQRPDIKEIMLGADYLDNIKDPYICNFHFDASQFLYEGDRVYWKKDSFPRFRQRRSVLAEPFPWEMALSSDKRVGVPILSSFECSKMEQCHLRISFNKEHKKFSF